MAEDHDLTAIEPDSEYTRLGITPTPDDGTRVSSETARGTNPPVRVGQSRRQRSPTPAAVACVGQHLIDVHDMLRRELAELRDLLGQVREGALTAGDARSALNDMTLRQNDWTLGAFCARYCGAITGHHGLEDDAIFPHLARSEPSLSPVIDRLVAEHLTIHDAVMAVDRALVDHINHPTDYRAIQSAIDLLTDALLSHLSYEEREIVEPLARLGFYPGQV